jgi:hypothetical protein
VCVECFFLSNGILYFLLSLNQLIRILFLRVDSSSAEPILPMNSQENEECIIPHSNDDKIFFLKKRK